MEKERGEFFNNFFTGVVISSLTFLAAALIPLFGSVLLILSPLPILYYCFRNGRIQGFTILIISSSVVAFILISLDSIESFPILFLSGCLGILLSETLKQGYSIEKTVIYPVVTLLIIWSSFIFYQSTSSGVSPWGLIENYIDRNIRDSIQLYAKLDVPEEQLKLIRDNTEHIAGFFMDIFPALALISATFTVWLNILSGREILKKNGGGSCDFGDLSCWKAPEKLVWLLIVSGGMLLTPIEWINFAGLNLLIVCLFVYLFQGLAIVSFFFRRRNVPRFFRMMFYFLIFAQQYVTILIVATGLFDLWINFRKHIRPATE